MRPGSVGKLRERPHDWLWIALSALRSLTTSGLAASLTLLAGCSHEPPPSGAVSEPRQVSFERIELSSEFTAEGATFGDLNRDGLADAIAGPYWYEGPGFGVRHVIYPPVAFDPKNYSDNFFAFVEDLDRDGWNDLLVVGFPGEAARWYKNPREGGGMWEVYVVFAAVDNEAPAFTNLGGSAAADLVFSTERQLGWAEPNTDPAAPWSFHAISPEGPYETFTHGLGVADLDGDGDRDILEATGWWERPNTGTNEMLWRKHPHAFGSGGAQMFAYDVDGDGDQDVLTTLGAHGYGVAWFEREGAASEERYVRHLISSDAPGPDALHEPHALAVVDMNGDGLLDLVCGERFWGHYPTENPNFEDPARLVWFELRRAESGVEFVPHPIDSASGVGTQVVATDANRDDRPDIIVANKKGAFVFLQKSDD